MRPGQPTNREKLFCWYYVTLGNPAEAARLAGYPKRRGQQAAELLQREDIRRECGRVSALLQGMPCRAKAGLERLAFGSINDALRLLYQDGSGAAESLGGLDLFCVREIKRTKDGGVELKFHDRQEALTALLAMEGKTERAAGSDSLYNAILRSAGAAGAEN